VLGSKGQRALGQGSKASERESFAGFFGLGRMVEVSPRFSFHPPESSPKMIAFGLEGVASER
jgi:hypothetical protein